MDDAPITICHWCCSFCMKSCDRDGWWRWVPSPCRQTGQNSLEDIKKRDLEKELAEKESKNVEEKRREESVVALSLSLSLVPSLDAVLCARALCLLCAAVQTSSAVRWGAPSLAWHRWCFVPLLCHSPSCLCMHSATRMEAMVCVASLCVRGLAPILASHVCCLVLPCVAVSQSRLGFGMRKRNRWEGAAQEWQAAHSHLCWEGRVEQVRCFFWHPSCSLPPVHICPLHHSFFEGV